MRRLSFERSRCLACRSYEIACAVAHSLTGARAEVVAQTDSIYRKLVFRGDLLVGALLVGDITAAGDFYRRYREAARPPGAERG